jgi:hypothetical protein
MSSITTSYSTMQITRGVVITLALAGGIAYLFRINKEAKAKAKQAAKEKAAKEKVQCRKYIYIHV